MTLGENIQRLRKEKKLSQEQLAEMIGVSRQAVSKWELGNSAPDIEYIIKLCSILKVASDELLDTNYNTVKENIRQENIPNNKHNEQLYNQPNTSFEQAVKFAKKHKHFAGYYLIVIGAVGLLLSIAFAVVSGLMFDYYDKQADSMQNESVEQIHQAIDVKDFFDKTISSSLIHIKIERKLNVSIIIACVVGGISLICIIIGSIIAIIHKKVN